MMVCLALPASGMHGISDLGHVHGWVLIKSLCGQKCIVAGQLRYETFAWAVYCSDVGFEQRDSR